MKGGAFLALAAIAGLARFMPGPIPGEPLIAWRRAPGSVWHDPNRVIAAEVKRQRKNAKRLRDAKRTEYGRHPFERAAVLEKRYA